MLYFIVKIMKLAIFDMDGTLFDTNEINYYAYKGAFEKYNISIDYEYYCNYCNGRHYKVFVSPLLNDNEYKIEDVHNIKKSSYSKYLNKVKVNEHLFNIIENIKNDYKIALVTTASKKNTYEILEYTKKSELFDLILTSEDVKNSKPDPEGFILAMSKFNSEPNECIIFEDSGVGIEAAKKTGATVIKVEKF